MCAHQWRANKLSEHYYHSKNQRNTGTDGVLDRKLKSRIQIIAPLLQGGMRILEIGCAEGHLGAAIKRLANVEYIGIEISEDACLASPRLDTVVRLPASAYSVPAFDLLVAFHVMEHISDIEAEMTHWMRLLKQDGTLILEVPNRAGHPLLSQDCNPEHLHFFSAASLVSLLQRFGLDPAHLSSGNYESPVYPDSLRVIARKLMDDSTRKVKLTARFFHKLGDKFVIFGAGGDFHNYVEPLLDALPVVALCDSNPDLHGHLIGKQTVIPYNPVRFANLPVLIASIRFKSEIADSLLSLGVPASAIVGLDDIYGEIE
jgi:SAM-dependent methyltransferase